MDGCVYVFLVVWVLVSICFGVVVPKNNRVLSVPCRCRRTDQGVAWSGALGLLVLRDN
jgi:membrane associated rhomboid family serine protease